ncbi:ATP-dependent RNA helicase DHX8 [Podospora didyma]|uniref:ATP-dependent RNA helicase DHX8 n=1 Tax=Podospora didyma TaxID=330526 RepID=A0AAE0NZR4_9PEZI|nr:ATP-dependent RNA helicase DHX8 [Podospora didyma]
MAEPTPYREIRAHYDDETITVYQAYSNTIASAAVAAQKLNASPAFRTTRMTWMKPSWAWMLYRAGYSYKDLRQERILALRMKHADFISVLERGVLSHGGTINMTAGKLGNDETQQTQAREKEKEVRVQWDPERTVRLDKLEYRSIQIGIPAALSETWVENMIVGIEDVTQRARDLKKVLDERPDVTDEELVELGLVPVERSFPVSEELQRILQMVKPATQTSKDK